MQKKSDTCWNVLLLKKIHNLYETWSKWLPGKVSILTKSHTNWAKIVDFLIKSHFSMCPIFFCTRLYFSPYLDQQKVFSLFISLWPMNPLSGSHTITDCVWPALRTVVGLSHFLCGFSQKPDFFFYLGLWYFMEIPTKKLIKICLEL